MTTTSQTVLERFQIRKSRKQKAAFTDWLCETLRAQGYAPEIEEIKSLVTSRNVIVGDPEQADLLLTAHYDTCAVLPFPNFITPRNLFWYILYNVLIIVPLMALTGGLFALCARLMPASPFLPLVSELPLLIFCGWILGLGAANRHTANDNTSGVVTLIEILLSLPAEQRGRVCCVFFDNEECGLFGSGGFARRHRSVRKKTLTLNFDCVGDGDSIQFFPTSGANADRAAMELLERAFLPQGEKSVEVVRGFGMYPSDQKNFRRGVGVCALRRSRVFGWYMDKIHTGRDRVLDERNVELLRVGVLRLAEIVRG